MGTSFLNALYRLDDLLCGRRMNTELSFGSECLTAAECLAGENVW